MTRLLPAVELGPGQGAVGTVLWLHGLGASGHDFEGIVPLLDLPRVRFVFPHAPERPVTINAGLIMPAWYDIRHLGTTPGREDEAGILESARLIEALLEHEEERGVPASRIILAGFSQGGAIALYVGTRYSRSLLGIMVLSGYDVLAGRSSREATEANAATPLLFCHGTLDPMVPVGKGREAFEAHAGPGRDAEWREFPMGHEVCPEEITRIRRWLGARFDTGSRTGGAG